MSNAIGTAPVAGTALAEPIGPAMTCPPWCIEDVKLGDGIVLHSGERGVLEIDATEELEEHEIMLRPERVDRENEIGPTLVTLIVDRSTVVEMPPAALRVLLRLGTYIADRIGAQP